MFHFLGDNRRLFKKMVLQSYSLLVIVKLFVTKLQYVYSEESRFQSLRESNQVDLEVDESRKYVNLGEERIYYDTWKLYLDYRIAEFALLSC